MGDNEQVSPEAGIGASREGALVVGAAMGGAAAVVAARGCTVEEDELEDVGGWMRLELGKSHNWQGDGF